MPRFPESQIEKFFTRILFTGNAGSIVLASLVGSGNERHIFDWDLPENAADFDFKQQLEDIITYAQDDCNGYGVASKYVIIAYADEADVARSPTFELKPIVEPGEEDEEAFSEDEDDDRRPPPEASRMMIRAPKGPSGPAQDMALTQIIVAQGAIIGQMMRHSENKERLFNTGMHQVLTVQRDTIAKLSSQNENYQTAHLGLIDKTEKLKSKDHERSIELRKIEKGDERFEAIMQKVMQLGPVVLAAIAAKYLGGPAALGAQSPDVILLLEAVKETFMSIDDKQVDALSKILRPEQMISLKKAIDTFALVEEKKEGTNDTNSPAVENEPTGNNTN